MTSPPLFCLHNRRTQNDHSIFEYGLHVLPSNFFLSCPSHLSCPSWFRVFLSPCHPTCLKCLIFLGLPKAKPTPYPWTLSLLFSMDCNHIGVVQLPRPINFLEHKFLSCIMISNVYPMIPIILSASLVQYFWTKRKISKLCILKLQLIQKRVLVMDHLR